MGRVPDNLFGSIGRPMKNVCRYSPSDASPAAMTSKFGLKCVLNSHFTFIYITEKYRNIFNFSFVTYSQLSLLFLDTLINNKIK